MANVEPPVEAVSDPAESAIDQALWIAQRMHEYESDLEYLRTH